MSDEPVLIRCPICERGELVLVGHEVWQCERPSCNNEFFHDGEPGQRILNVRDKPSPLKQRRSVGRAMVGVLMAAAGVGVMCLEGQHQPSPGIGFAIGMILIGLSVVPWKRHSPNLYHCVEQGDDYCNHDGRHDWETRR